MNALERPTEEEARALIERAQEARRRAYAPYSGFPVGAALLIASGATPGAEGESEVGSGTVIIGCNIENAAYPLTLCAERVALGSAVALGIETPGVAHAFRAIAIVGPQDDVPCWPCGSCRQALSEFSPDIWVISPSGRKSASRGFATEDEEAGEVEFEMVRLSELLPRPFGPRTLERGR